MLESESRSIAENCGRYESKHPIILSSHGRLHASCESCVHYSDKRCNAGALDSTKKALSMN